MEIKDTKITKNLRPATLIWTIVLFTVILFWDAISEEFNVPKPYLDIIELVFIAEIGFYFTSRGLEKVWAIRERGKYQREDNYNRYYHRRGYSNYRRYDDSEHYGGYQDEDSPYADYDEYEAYENKRNKEQDA